VKTVRAVGLFDSGVGGLTVVNEIYRALPLESTICFGDSAHVPYGSRSAEELIYLADKIVSFLINQGVKYIIFACNTNSSLSLPILQKRYPIPMIGLVQPGAKWALQVSRNRRVGVIATEATVQSASYERAIKAMDANALVFSQAAPKLVPLIEAGKIDTTETRMAINEYLTSLKKNGIDTLILGCSHYPFLSKIISEELGPEVVLVDPAQATVLEAKADLAARGLLNYFNGQKPQHQFYVSGDPKSFQAGARIFLGESLTRVVKVELL
jgi:glutamate racemase